MVPYSQLGRLRVLNLQNNQLASLPTQMGSLTSLEELLLADNNLDFLPVEVSAPTFLRHLLPKAASSFTLL